MQPAWEENELDDDKRHSGDEHAEGSDDEEDEDPKEKVVEIIAKRQKRSARSAQGVAVEELLVRRTGYEKPVWIELSQLIDRGHLSIGLLQSFERKQKAEHEQAQLAARRNLPAPGPAPQRAPPKGKKKPRSAEPAKESYPTVDLSAPVELSHTHMELEENAALRNIYCGFNNYSFKVTVSGESLFCKVNTNSFAMEMFRAEAAGLNFYKEHSKHVIIPEVIAIMPLLRRVGAVIVMQFLPVHSPSAQDRQRLARKIAEIHSVQVSHQFGCPFDTYWGSIRQPAGLSPTWPEFLLKYRFLPLIGSLRRSPDSYEIIMLAERLMAHMNAIFSDIPPGGIAPVLLHGDLTTISNWSGLNDSIVLYDMVPMFGHSEMDIYKMDANDFRAEYEKAHPPLPNTPLRKELYSLYYELVKLRTEYSPARASKNCLNFLRALFAVLEPPVVREFPFGSSLPLGKLIDPANPTAEAENVVLFFNGSFSPVHVNHLSVMESARRWMETHKKARVLGGWFCPSTDDQLNRKLKVNSSEGLPRHTRLTALISALLGTQWSVMDESRSPVLQPAFIKETLMRMRGWRVSVAILYGADNFRFASKMINAGHLIVVVRRNSYDQELKDAVARVPPKQLAQLCIDEEWTGPDISSSRIRSALKAGDWQAVTSMLPPRVAEVIRAHLLATKGKAP